MKSAPCVRFAIRISPKISENPDDSRNRSPPRARLLNVWMAQNCMAGGHKPGARAGAARTPVAPGDRSGLEVLRRRPVARVHRVREEGLRVVGPELADGRVGENHRVHQPTVLPLYPPDVDVADDVAVVVERDRAAAGEDVGLL